MIRIGLPALFALFALAVCGRQAQASCGDWLAGHSEVAANRRQANPMNAPLRCNGPACRHAPIPAPLPPIPLPTIDVDKAALIDESFVDVSATASDCFGMPASDIWPGTAYHSPLERPPRS
jgi:hypothetical protein